MMNPESKWNKISIEYEVERLVDESIVFFNCMIYFLRIFKKLERN